MSLKDDLMKKIAEGNLWKSLADALYFSEHVPPEKRHGKSKDIVMYVLDTNPEAVCCKTCGEITTFLGDQLCVNCWEVEARIEKYAQSENGRRLLEKILKEYQK